MNTLKAITAQRYGKALLYLAAIVLINIVGLSLFMRFDLTANKAYSLSEASRNAVATLGEPLTVKVFFTSELPAPYNNIERYLRDLLQEYAVHGNKFFNYEFYRMGKDNEQNAQIAKNYGLYPLQIQDYEKDELKFINAYMGVVLIHGDLVETLEAVTNTDGLEFLLSSRIRKMNNKISALARLKDNVEVRLYLSSSLLKVGPYMNLTGLAELPTALQSAVEKLSRMNYGKLSYSFIDPSITPIADSEARKYNMLPLGWNEFTDRQGNYIEAGRGFAGLVVMHGQRFESIPVIRAVNIPIFGTQYQKVPVEELDRAINEGVENVIDINAAIGYLRSHNTLALGAPDNPTVMQGEGLDNFEAHLSEGYSITQLDLADSGNLLSLPSLIIAGPKKPFTDYELYQIDQYLMQGRSLALFIDPYMEIEPPADTQSRMFNQMRGPMFVPLATGLEKLLTHYGIKLKKGYVLDEKSFKQQLPQQMGGGKRNIYFAPMIQGESINRSLPYLDNIKGLVMFKSSPVEIDPKVVQQSGLKATNLFTSSPRGWLYEGVTTLNPATLEPPADASRFSAIPLAHVVEGQFTSYFADKPVPERVLSPENQTGQEQPGTDMSAVTSDSATIKKGKPSRIFIIGTSEVLKDSLIDKAAKNPNAQFVLNVIDYLNGNTERARMRSKRQGFNPLKELEPSTRTLLKALNIVGLPVLVALAGIVVWMRRASRKRLVRMMFAGSQTAKEPAK